MKADLSRKRRRHVLDLVRRTGLLTDNGLTDDARLLYVVGGLICNDAGVAKQADLTAAMRDPSIVQAARTILTKAARR